MSLLGIPDLLMASAQGPSLRYARAESTYARGVGYQRVDLLLEVTTNMSVPNLEGVLSHVFGYISRAW